jgi:WD40 repeat protein
MRADASPIDIATHGGLITAVAFDKDDQMLIACSEEYTPDAEEDAGVIRFWRVADQQLSQTIQDIDRTGLVSFPSQGRLFAWVGKSSHVFLCDRISGSAVAKIALHGDHAYGIDFSPDGRLLASGGNQQVTVWDVNALSVVKTFPGPSGYCCVAFSPDGTKLCAGGFNGIVRIWSLIPPYELIGQLDAQRATVRAVKFIGGDDVVASASADKSLMIWDTTSHRSVRIAPEIDSKVFALAYSPTLDLLACGGEDRRVRLWDWRKELKPAVLAGVLGEVTALALSPNGTRLAAGDASGRLVYWTLE